MTEGAWPNLAAMMFARAAAWPDRTLLRWHRHDAWHSMTWGTFARQAAAAARGLRAAGLQAGDRVVIASENRPEWLIAELALMALRAVVVPAYVTNTVADHAHLLADSGARAAMVSSAALAGRLAAAGTLDLLVQFDADPAPPAVAWVGLLQGVDQPPDDVVAEANLIGPDILACLIYTSGTGGPPKGVQLPHRCLIANCRGAEVLVRELHFHRDMPEVYLSFLPASHSYEHLVGGFFLPSQGVEIAYARGIEHLAADMQAVQPTLMTVVPRILDVIHARIRGQVAREPAWRRALFAVAVRIGERRSERQRLALWERLADPLLERLVRRKVRARFGGRMRAMMSGGARLEPEVGRFFRALGMAVMQGYGQTEAGPVIAANPPEATRIDTVGKPLPGVQVRLADDGEILVRGDLVMDGYWGRPADTDSVLRDGWLHTGDIGTIDADGYLRITDRKKDMIALSSGEKISPAKIEGRLVALPEIAQAVVFGEGRTALGALVVAAEGVAEPQVSQAIAALNRQLATPERVRRHALVEPFTVDNKLLTATQKVRRHLVLAAHAALVDQLAA